MDNPLVSADNPPRALEKLLDARKGWCGWCGCDAPEAIDGGDGDDPSMESPSSSLDKSFKSTPKNIDNESHDSFIPFNSIQFNSIQLNSIEINQLFHEIKIQPNEIEMFGKMIHFIQWNRKEWSRVDCEGV